MSMCPPLLPSTPPPRALLHLSLDSAPIPIGEAAHRVNAVLLAEVSSLRTSVTNRDVYQLRVTPLHGAAFDAIAIDSYPGYAEALPLRDMRKDVRFSVKLIRTPYCDEGNGEGQETLRCFAIERGSWKGPKSAAEQWWK